MKFSKHIFTLFLAFALLIPLVTVFPQAQPESNDWLFIDGVNITRQVDCAVLYRNVKRTGQTRWGFDIVIDDEGRITEIFKNGEGNEDGTAVPEGGAVISASGKKGAWLESKVSVGDVVYFDEYTQRLFVYNDDGEIKPYVTDSFSVTAFNNSYTITESEGTDYRTDYVYAVTVDANGRVIARGREAEIPEGGFVVYGTTAETRNRLIVCAPLGASCTIENETLTFSFGEKDLKTCLDLALADATRKIDAAKNGFSNLLSFSELDSLITAATQLSEGELDYESVFDMMQLLDMQVDYFCTEGQNAELRAAFHTPEETSDEGVRKTLLEAQKAGLNTIILRVSNGYGTFIPLPEDNLFSQDEKFNNFDILKSYVKNCKDNGISLALCFDVYYNENAVYANPDWLSETNNGETGMSEKFFSPQDQGFKKYYIDYVKYVITHYDIDTVMFDSLRYPKFSKETDYGYDYDTLKIFSQQYEIPWAEAESIATELTSSPHWSDWVEYRMGLVSSMARDLSTAVREARSDINLLFVAQRDTMGSLYLQDSTKWISDKLFDGVCVALYERDEEEKDFIGDNAYYDDFVTDKCELFANYTSNESFLFVGLDASGDIEADLINDAVNDVRRVNGNGFVINSLYDFIPKASEVNLKSSVTAPAVSPLNGLEDIAPQVLNAIYRRVDNIYNNGALEREPAAEVQTKISETLTALEEASFGIRQALRLEEEIEIILATANPLAKNEILDDLKVLTKITRLAKVKIEAPEEPPIDEPEVSGDESLTPDEPSSDDSVEEAPAAPSDSVIIQNNEKPFAVSFGEILIYVFVAFTGVVAITALVVGIKRKRNTPSNRHMPKGSAKGYEDKK